MNNLSQQQLVNMLRDAVAQAGGVNKYARLQGISNACVSRTLSGDLPVGTTIAACLGYMPVTRFEPIRREIVHAP